jgi:hypothetical protein
MNTMRLKPLTASVVTLCLIGCKTVSTPTEGWAYYGSDTSLRYPPLVRPANLDPGNWQELMHERMSYDSNDAAMSSRQQRKIVRARPAKPERREGGRATVLRSQGGTSHSIFEKQPLEKGIADFGERDSG